MLPEELKTDRGHGGLIMLFGGITATLYLTMLANKDKSYGAKQEMGRKIAIAVSSVITIAGAYLTWSEIKKNA